MWTRFCEEMPENNRKIKVILFGNGRRCVFFSDGKFYKNKSQKERGRSLDHISKYEQYSTKQNMVTHWKYV